MTHRPSSSRHLGLDLGGSSIKWVVGERRGTEWTTVDRGHVDTAAVEGRDAVVARLAAVAVQALTRSPGASTIGIGVPGLYDPSAGTTRFLVNLPGDWSGTPVAAVVGAAARVPACLVNDARAFGLAELRLGAGRGASSMVGLTLGTGVGGVLALDGRIHQGHDGTAGELGHQTIVPDGPWCGCGNRGCLEAFVRADQIAMACGTESAEEGLRRARAGDARAVAAVAEIGRYLGIGIANVVSVFTPDRIIIGGGVAAGLDLLLDPIRGELRRRVKTTALGDVEIVAAELGNWAGAIGAAVHGAEAHVPAVPSGPAPEVS